MDRLRLARAGEQQAARHLVGNGLRILERNYRCRLGEVDLIAADGDTLVFVEVKTRSGPGFGAPAEAVGAAKQRKLRQVAAVFVSRAGWAGPCRFDVVSVRRSRGKLEVEHLRDAF